ncbi:hypothetical protein LSM04_003336 [Trypanosoma melophagium]|uniref:uncharacterized protein n=1 Tax=Trypanosoma melophagium TaxID=715481 RepID=UPI00351A6090|nr:hypothetical protein LSM04_003336 [Trypanosoma melophagium]
MPQIALTRTQRTRNLWRDTAPYEPRPAKAKAKGPDSNLEFAHASGWGRCCGRVNPHFGFALHEETSKRPGPTPKRRFRRARKPLGNIKKKKMDEPFMQRDPKIEDARSVGRTSGNGPALWAMRLKSIGGKKPMTQKKHGSFPRETVRNGRAFPQNSKTPQNGAKRVFALRNGKRRREIGINSIPVVVFFVGWPGGRELFRAPAQSSSAQRFPKGNPRVAKPKPGANPARKRKGRTTIRFGAARNQ